jgi:hypothetical protein
MNAQELDLRAQALYDACPTVKPAWSQLGETTRSVWRDRAVAEIRSSSTVAPEPVANKVALPESMSLF